MRNAIVQGDALAVLRALPAEHVQCVVTSPPYYGLRDYGIEGQIGLEETPAAYVAKLVEVFREVRRVLRSDGTCWLNLGDSYAGSGKGGQSEEKRSENWQPTYAQKGNTPQGFKPKDLMMIPARVAIALCDDGWYLRSDIVWHKTNAMPESVTDRPTKAHEYVFLLSKNERYFYDSQAILESFNPNAHISYEHKGAAKYGPMGGTHGGPSSTLGTAGRLTDRPGRNKRSVWSIPTQSFPGSHFAVMAPKLAETCILAGTSPRACEHCGAPWQRVTERTPMIIRNGPKAGAYGSRTTDGLSGTMIAPAESQTVGWQPTCSCPNNTGSGRCIVLDPFMGAGTVALVALQHHRDYLGIELNPAYVELARNRIATVQPHLWDCEVSA